MLASLLDPSIGLYCLGVFGDSPGNLRVVLSRPISLNTPGIEKNSHRSYRNESNIYFTLSKYY
jgi:hypothetical protein